MGPLAWVLVGSGCYVLAAMLAQRRGRLPDWIEVSGPVTTIHTKRGRRLLNRLADYDRFWRAFGTLAVAVAFLLMVLLAGVVLVAARAALSGAGDTAVARPQNTLVVPGVNDFLPLSVAPELLVGLLLALAVHEGAHGVLCRVGGIEVESVGVFLLGPIPTGAFVDPDDATAEAASLGVLNRMFAAGILTNLVVAALAFGLLFGPVGGAIAVAPGAAVGGVVADSPAADAGIAEGDRITAIDGQAVADADALDAALADGGCSVSVELDGGRETTLRRGVTVAESTAPLERGTRLVSVGGESVCTVEGFERAAGDRERVTVTTEGGEGHELVVGARVTPTADGSLSAAGAPSEPLTVVRVDGERVHSTDALRAALGDRSPGETVEVVAYRDDASESRRYTVALGDDDGGAYLGVVPQRGISGYTLVDTGVGTYPAEEMLSLFRGQGGDPFGFGPASLVLVVVLLPLAATVGFAPYNFPGIEGAVASFYTVPGLPTPFDGGVFVVANVLFWTGWVNVQLALFNAIPAFPLDGGKLLHTSAGSLGERVGAPDRTATVVAGLATLVMFGAVTAMLVGPML